MSEVITSFCGLCILLAVGKFMRLKVKLLQKLYLPSSIIGGIVGLVVLSIWGDSLAPWHAGWSGLPGFLINIVFAALFLGVSIPPLKKIWQSAGPQVVYGQIVAWGQYVVGLGVVLLLLSPLLGKVPDLLGVIIPVGFEGGHGTAGGLRDTFIKLGWNEGVDLALASATVGIISAVVFGMMLINWAARKGYITQFKDFESQSIDEQRGVYPPRQSPPAGRQTVSPDSIDSLALHLAFIGLAVFIGYLFKQSFTFIDNYSLPAVHELGILRSFPLFPLCMIGGLIVQKLLSLRPAAAGLIDHQLMQRLSGTALDFLVVAAISTIRLEIIWDNIVPFTAIVCAGIIWNIFCVLFLARRLLPNFWFERSIAEMGQSMGVTATGLLLLRTVDPEGRTEAPSAFGYKQLVHEPFMGGGLWTSTAVPLVALHGGWLVFFISVGVIILWLVIWRALWGRGFTGNK